MPGFLAVSGYEGTERIDLGNGYWVDVKKCLSAAEKGRVDDLLGGRQRVDVASKSSYAELDYTASRAEMVVLSLDDWNLDDEKGKKWPLDAGAAPRKPGDVNPYPPGCPRRQSVARLPGPVFDQIWERCDELNAPRAAAEAAQFPEQDERGDQDGDTRAADPDPVPDGTGVLEGAGAEAGYAA